MRKEKVICLSSSEVGYLSKLVREDVERIRQSLHTGDYFDRRSQEAMFKKSMELYERLGSAREFTASELEELRPKGQWIERVGLGEWICSECQHEIYLPFGETPEEIGTNYCPSCGAKMEE